jgi:hypothetical protein
MLGGVDPAVALRSTAGYAHLALAGLGKKQREKEIFLCHCLTKD